MPESVRDMGEDRPESEDLRRIIDSARRLGIEIDEGEALQWLAAIAVTEADIVKDERAGVYGHRVAMLDFSDADLAHFRRVGGIVGFSDSPGVETALALSGSAAQSKIQTTVTSSNGSTFTPLAAPRPVHGWARFSATRP
ncbi:MAG: hypothetical protein ACE5MI_03770 [Acidimicrobiia bacterium]